MRPVDDYKGDMPKSTFSEQDIEQLLSGGMPEASELQELVPLVERLRLERNRTPAEEAVTRFAVEAATIVSSASGYASTSPKKELPPPRRLTLTLRKKMATVLAAVVLLTGMTGVAVASDQAAPGDPLYGIDQALESIGIGNGGVAERVAEARVLAAESKAAEALAHAAEAIAQDTNVEDASNASEALRSAAEEVQTGNDEAQSQEIRDAVAAMLQRMAELLELEELDGQAFGEEVSSMAKELGGPPEQLPANDAAGEAHTGEGPPEELPAGPPEGLPDGPPEQVPPTQP